jgi:uncharacterized protein
MAHPVADPGPPRAAPSPDEPPRWPAWYAPVGFMGAAGLTLLGGGLVVALLHVTGLAGQRTALGVVQTLVQDAALVLCAVTLAARTARPRLWHFGLGRAALGPIVKWIGVGYLAFIAFGQGYGWLFDPEGEQRIVDRLGADDSLPALVAVGVLVIVLAPVVEELFFRGFFYRALRSRFSFVAAALIDGAVFGVIHYSGSETLSILPVFVALGFIFCWVYERTGSLYAPIAMHALNNTLAYANMTRLSDVVPAAIGAAVVAGCLIAPRVVRGPAVPAHVS